MNAHLHNAQTNELYGTAEQETHLPPFMLRWYCRVNGTVSTSHVQTNRIYSTVQQSTQHAFHHACTLHTLSYTVQQRKWHTHHFHIPYAWLSRYAQTLHPKTFSSTVNIYILVFWQLLWDLCNSIYCRICCVLRNCFLRVIFSHFKSFVAGLIANFYCGQIR